MREIIISIGFLIVVAVLIGLPLIAHIWSDYKRYKAIKRKIEPFEEVLNPKEEA